MRACIHDALDVIIALRVCALAHVATSKVNGTFVVRMLTRAELQIASKPLCVVVDRLHENVEPKVVYAHAHFTPSGFYKEGSNFFRVPICMQREETL